MSAATTIAMVVSAVVAAAGTIASADAQRRTANQAADVAQQNADIAKQKAAMEEGQHRDYVSKVLSRQRALYGASGVEGTEGTPLEVMGESAAQGELDSLTIRYGGDVEAARQTSAANLYKMQGEQAMSAGTATAGATLLAGVGKAYGQYYKSQRGLSIYNNQLTTYG